MKCPKCGYLGFEQLDRCRNCGYEFALAAPTPLPDLTLRHEETPGPTSEPSGELTLTEDVTRTRPEAPRAAALDIRRETLPEARRETPPEIRRENLTRGGGVTPELPLFTRSTQAPSDEPLISKPSAPRPPLAVRRATPDVPRLRSERRSSGAAILEPSAAETIVPAPLRRSPDVHTPSDELDDEDIVDRDEPAALTDRLIGALIDVLVLVATDLVVVYLTMQICGLPLAELRLLPRRPLLVYLVIQNGGYLVAFTATGQTLGKVAAGIRVVSSMDGRSPRLGQALLRSILWVLLAAPAGLGVLTTLFSRDRRGLHDRAAGTRVIRADI
ncbi:MAG: hypothetical protein DMF90_27650 [Acidobacteria bacterium]|nr:MAG: hypothetical protein DMF90_27650 [Acidobacteriota bacterium]